ncbi:MAG: hypothetical protein AAB916_02855 [Patescibacteria group bacterium]
MTTKITDLRDFYKVLKTITFELRAVDLNDQGVQFQKTLDFVNQEYFPVSKKSSDGIDELKEILRFGSELVGLSDRFTAGLTQKSFDWFGFDARKTLIEKFDRDRYHWLKKKRKIIVPVKNPDTGRAYQKQLIFQDPMPLYAVIMMTDGTGYQLTDTIGKLTERIQSFQSKIKGDLLKIYSKYTETEKVIYYESGKVVFYGFVRSYLSLIKDLMAIFDLIAVSPRDIKESPKKECTRKIQKDLEAIKSAYQDHATTITSLKDVIDEEAKKPIIWTTLNPRAVNKDQKKIEKEYASVLEMEEKKKMLEWDLDELNNKKFAVVQALENKLKDSIPELEILKEDMQPLINVLFNKKKYNYSPLTDEEKENLRKHTFAKTILKYIKIEGVVISDKQDIENYRQPGERLARKREEYRQIEQVEEFNAFKKEYRDYGDFCKEKKRQSHSTWQPQIYL